MDEQRLQAYVSLIEKLLGCPQGQEAALLQANAELVNAELVTVMEQVTASLESQGDSNAGWLRGFAAQLAQLLEKVESTGWEDATKFLLEMLQLVADNQGDPQQIYPVWAQQQAQLSTVLLEVLPYIGAWLFNKDVDQRPSVAATLVNFGSLINQFPLGTRWLNLELGIAACELALQVFTSDTSSELWATTMNNLALAYADRIQGNRAENLEKAISAYQQALMVRTKTEMPVDWAASMNNLALAYADRIRGNRAENLEKAISAYQQALMVRTKTEMPVDWAASMMNLATAYYLRIRENRAENLEKAISTYQQALTVRIEMESPALWATTMNNLALAYVDRIRGDRAENLEQAISACQQALTVRTKTEMPVDWAATMNNLAISYQCRIRGDRSENLEQAISAYQQALTVRTKTEMPVDWAQSMNNLALAYADRVRGDRAENLEQAISAYQQALTVRTKTEMPVDWATTMNNLALAYADRIRGDRAENLEQAILAYQQALTVTTETEMPMDWSQSMSNLANVYAQRIQGDRAENLEQAISAYQKALTVRTKTEMPVDWATTMMNLATTYKNRVGGKRASNIEQAIAHYQSSLEIFKPRLLPDNCRRSAASLANLFSKQQRWQEAIPSYQMALQAAEILYQSANLLDGKAAELTETADLPRRAAYALAHTGNLQEAALTLERGRARGLSETLDRDRSNLSQLQQTDPEIFTQYQDITQQLRNLEIQQRLRMTSEERHSLTPEAFRTEALRLRQTLTQTIEQIRQVEGYADFLAQPSFDDIRQAIRPGIPLVYLVPTPTGSLALIVNQTGIADLWLDDLTQTSLGEVLTAWFNAYSQSQTNRQSWYDAIDQGTRQLWQPLMAPLIDHLKQHSFQQATLIPTGYLSLLPLHAAWTEDATRPDGKRYALDEIHFTYAPNAQSINAAKDIAQRTEADSMLAIDNPLKDLPNSSREVNAAIATFPQHKVLKHEEAAIESVLTALPHYNILHLACHGTANLRDPLTSGLMMSDRLITLRNLLDLKLAEENRGGIRLAILSACETGLAGIDLADEAISLPTGLLQAGVAGVAASLWAVSDLSTMLLLTRFYDFWRNEELDISQALRQAQQWVRDTTNIQKYDYLKDVFQELADTQQMTIGETNELLKEFMIDYVYRYGSQDKSFAHPFHWAAFHYVGV
ncbi:MAG: tetratricopeptide repeat protein [Drouetiella hepatica Uher 2000/2452]|jgi:CHAT domain-containing protein/tetratricopeptide (TPR) repeat protein|uniref:Tetratricopeptide repeat protein n=1 Tax=Drouetiella hepatica Uher 2000/2452 TaxID=904376 RepID=A0A951QEF9_9CYAN|nr:tetratricopeptide repeat protein [Drouetiella hepatica Uher 2000/2452]